MAVNVPGECHIGQYRHSREKLYVLKCSADTHSDKIGSMEMSNVLAVKKYFPFLGMVKSGNAIEQTGFTSPIGTDDGHQFAGVNAKINILYSDNSAKGQMQALDFQLGFFIFFSPVTHYRWPAAKGFH